MTVYVSLSLAKCDLNLPKSRKTSENQLNAAEKSENDAKFHFEILIFFLQNLFRITSNLSASALSSFKSELSGFKLVYFRFQASYTQGNVQMNEFDSI